jgi:regulator of cell morphogenesis and NO signaling
MKNFSIDPGKSIAGIVREDYRTADTFKKFGINYCCGGKITLQDACQSMNLDLQEVQAELEKVQRTIIVFHQLDYNSWKVDFLIDYIINVHHAYLNSTMPPLLDQVTTFVNNHKKQYPYLQDVLKTFDQLITQLTIHIRHEEEIIFPYMKQIDNAYKRKESYGNLLVRTLRKPLINHEDEHLKINELFGKLRTLTNNYNIPADACTNHQVIYHKLEEFDDDMTQHKYLEDDILFPKAMNMEKELLHIQS